MDSPTRETQVEFRAPRELLDRTDALATALDIDRAGVLRSALREHLETTRQDDALVQEIAGAYYDDEIDYDDLEGLVGPAAAANHRVLKRQLDDTFLDDAADDLADS